ncbi:hypothetical protein [Flagellimonas amoyensis]|uniref:hypothetical protein n=1 Tax=Flagellimonas amoyensis TaxID=2169401 RepID=UPI000D39BE99|nr:hypothetical protein [Allomuricauda amoyensis]
MKSLLLFLFIILMVAVYLLGGFFQFFLGIPSTLYSMLVLGLLYLIASLTILARNGKVPGSNTILIGSLYVFLIIVSGTINNTELKKIILYFIFPLVPLGVFLAVDGLNKVGINIKKLSSFFFKILIIIQLPVILIQKYGYDFLIKFNNSNQFIGDYDFMFGSFFLKADHSLGFFLLTYFLAIIFQYRKGGRKQMPWFLMGYICVTILLLESNLTKLMFFIVLTYYGVIWANKRIRYSGVIAIFLVGYVMLNLALSVPKIQTELFFLKNKYTVSESVKAVERGYAKRPQIVISYFQEPLKIIGEGPYDYFNLLTGEFKKAMNFSQLIWTYNDLGIIGIMVIILLLFAIIKYLGLDRESRILLTFILLFYLFMTNVYYDIGMMLSLFIIVNRKNN